MRKEFLTRASTTHRAITAQEVAATEHVPGRMFAKTVMVLPDDEVNMVMLVLPAPYHVNPLKASAALGVSEVHLADEERFADPPPDCEVGAMPPFGNLYEVAVYVDRAWRRRDHSLRVGHPYRHNERLLR